MNLLIEILEELQHPEVMSFALLMLATGDTLTALMWRNKKDIAIFSKTLWLGFALNLAGAGAPYGVQHVPIFNHHDLFIKTALVLWTVIFGAATGFSLAANYKLYSAQSYEFLIENVPKILRAEVLNKLAKHKNAPNPEKLAIAFAELSEKTAQSAQGDIKPSNDPNGEKVQIDQSENKTPVE